MRDAVKRGCPSSLLFFLLILNVVCVCWTTPTHAQWTSVSPEGGCIISLAINPSTPQTIYAGTDGGSVFKSTNGGLTIQNLNNNADSEVDLEQ